ncbi:MAG: glucose 1-dehydrogenase [Cyanobacteria bacterium J06621_12]
MKGLKGKNVLVTGATSGIGQAIAAHFVTEGANVALNYRNKIEKLDATKELIKKMCEQKKGCDGKVFPVEADVSEESEITRMCSEVVEQFGSLDILINNAGIQNDAPSHELDTADFDKVIQVNLRGAFLCARETIKHFMARGNGGIIINVSSVHEIIPRPTYVSYSMSKGAMGNMTKTLALEYAPHGIRINAIAPGATATPINDSWAKDPAKTREVESHIPMGRVGTSEEMAAITAFLASDDAAYITGQTLFVDGGLTLYPDFLHPWSAGE